MLAELLNKIERLTTCYTVSLCVSMAKWLEGVIRVCMYVCMYGVTGSIPPSWRLALFLI